MSGDSLVARFPGLDPDLARLLDLARGSGQPPLTELDVAAARERVRNGDKLCAAGPDMLDVTDNPCASGVPMRTYTPRRHAGTELVWFHGGGWVTGDLGYSDGFCRLLAAGLGCRVHSVDYRLAPEHPFPAAVRDALLAVTDLGPDVIVAGDSAGGNLAAVCALELPVAGQVLLYPVLDCDTTRDSYRRNDGVVIGAREMDWFLNHYVPDPADRASPRFAPLRATSVEGQPPTVIAVADHDPLYDEGIAYAGRLRAAGTPVTLLDFASLGHGFLRFTGAVPAAADAAARVVAAVAALGGEDGP
jgi:acetyl esterase